MSFEVPEAGDPAHERAVYVSTGVIAFCGRLASVAVSPIPNGATIVAANDVLATEFGDEVVILNLRDGVYYGLEDVGTRIWQLLQQPVSVPVIREALVAEFDVEPARCERDIRLLLTDLAASGLVEIRGDV